jgi:hypothetical protein
LGYLQNPHLYVLSSGAQDALSPSGVYMRQNYGEEHEIAVAVDSRLWSVKFYLTAIGSWTQITLTFNGSTAGSGLLTVYVDGFPVGTDKTGSARLYSVSQFNQFANIVVGRANDIQSTTSMKGAAVWKLVHADTVYAQADVQTLVGELRKL